MYSIKLSKEERCLQKMRYALDVAYRWEKRSAKTAEMWNMVAIYWLELAISFHI